jgi:hypothetical protein
MGAIPSWVEVNWFNLIQTVGIMASLWLTAAAANREAKARNEEAVARHREAKAKEIENLLTNADHQRELWTDAYKRPELERVFQANVNLAEKPIKVAEKEFLNLVLVQYQITWCIAEAGGIVTMEELALDVRDFFSLPLPRAVWENVKGVRNPRFVEFVEGALGKEHQPAAG